MGIEQSQKIRTLRQAYRLWAVTGDMKLVAARGRKYFFRSHGDNLVVVGCCLTELLGHSLDGKSFAWCRRGWKLALGVVMSRQLRPGEQRRSGLKASVTRSGSMLASDANSVVLVPDYCRHVSGSLRFMLLGELAKRRVRRGPLRPVSSRSECYWQTSLFCSYLVTLIGFEDRGLCSS